MADSVKKVASGLLQSAPSRTSIKGKKTPKDLARTTVSDFFNGIGRSPPFETAIVAGVIVRFSL
jgi:hypothetical protein